jgi:limonene-1,2-epoxide hydrolase
MSMLDIQIDRLSLDVSGAEGHEHRIRPIAARAAAILAERLDESGDALAEQQQSRGTLRAPQARIDLARMTDEHAAQKIAQSWLATLGLGMQ